MRRRLRYLPLALLVLLPWGLTALYAVDQAEFAYVTRFGQPIEVIDGAEDAGLHVKLPWPIESVQRIDRRLHVFDLAPTETLTRDRQINAVDTVVSIDKTIAVDAYVCWRIPNKNAVDRFLRTMRTPEQAQQVLGARVRNQLAAVISRLAFDELIRTGDLSDLDARMEAIRRQLLGAGGFGEDLRAVAAGYGMELVDVRLRRFNYPETVRPSIHERIKSDRMLKATDYSTRGRERADAITSAAEAEALTIERTAATKADSIRDLADAEADRILTQAFGRDPAFAAFLRERRALREIFGDSTGTSFILSTTSGPFRWLFQQPQGMPQPPQMPGGPKE